MGIMGNMVLLVVSELYFSFFFDLISLGCLIVNELNIQWLFKFVNNVCVIYAIEYL